MRTTRWREICGRCGGRRLRNRCGLQLRLSLIEREEISRGLAGGESLRSIARRLGTVFVDDLAGGRVERWPPAISRVSSQIRLRCVAQRRPKPSKITSCDRLCKVVEAKLELRWSPQQISGWLVEEFPDDPEMRVSHETIYVSLFVQSLGALRKELTRYLRSGHTTRRPRGHTVMNGQGQLRGTLNIRERPAEADDRAVPGHSECDLLMVKRMHAMATLVERKTRFVMLIALPAVTALTSSRTCSPRRSPSSPNNSTFPDLGSRQRDGRAREVQCPDRCPGLLLRPA